MNWKTLPLALLTLAIPAAALAQNASAPGAIELYPTIESIGVRAAYSGDDNGNATARLEWRRVDMVAWTPGVTMTRITNKRWAGSVLWLEPGVDYDVRVVIDDPDGGTTIGGRATTRPNAPPTSNGATWWVAPNGDDNAAGSSAAPFRTLQAATNRAQAGDIVRVRPGLYYQTVDSPRSGTSTAPITLMADEAGVILDGSDPAMLHRTDWVAEGDGIYSAPYTGATRLVSCDSLMRLYRHADLAALQTSSFGMRQGWTLANGRLYVRLEDETSPAGHEIHVARYDNGIFLDQSWWTVKGFEVRHFGTGSAGSGIYLRAANHCTIRENNVHTIGGKGIYLRVLSSDNLIEENSCWDPRIGGWAWSATKSHEEEQQGISDRGGRGNVIRANSIYMTFDGIDVAGGESDENVGADTDIAYNVIQNTTDDAIEPETISGINVRVVRNWIQDVFSGMSISPQYQGPAYVLYNTFSGFRRSAFKFSYSSTAEVWICHNTVVATVAGTPTVHPSGPYSNVHFRNNIMTGNDDAVVSDDGGESQTGNDFDGDLIFANNSVQFRWKGINYSTLAALQAATGFESHGLAGDPLFVNAHNHDYTPAPGSRVIDAGLLLPGINDRYRGQRPDIGASEGSMQGIDLTPPSAITDLSIGP